MNKLDQKARAQILHLLCKGNSIRATTRLTGASKNTIVKLLISAGVACAAYQDRVLRNLPCKRVQVDEIWSFVYAKREKVRHTKAAPVDAGDCWTWTAICADTKLIAAFLIGDRYYGSARAFLDDLRERLADRVQLTCDGWHAYAHAVDKIFSDEIDYAQLQKIYGPDVSGEKRYSPPQCIGAKRVII